MSVLIRRKVSPRSTEGIVSYFRATSTCKMSSRNVTIFRDRLSEVGENNCGLAPGFGAVERATSFTIVSNSGTVKPITTDCYVRCTIERSGRIKVFAIFTGGGGAFNPTFCCPLGTTRRKVVNFVYSGDPSRVTPVNNERGVVNAGPFSIMVPIPKRSPVVVSVTADVITGSGFGRCGRTKGRLPRN